MANLPTPYRNPGMALVRGGAITGISFVILFVIGFHMLALGILAGAGIIAWSMMKDAFKTD